MIIPSYCYSQGIKKSRRTINILISLIVHCSIGRLQIYKGDWGGLDVFIDVLQQVSRVQRDKHAWKKELNLPDLIISRTVRIYGRSIHTGPSRTRGEYAKTGLSKTRGENETRNHVPSGYKYCFSRSFFLNFLESIKNGTRTIYLVF